MDNAGLRCATAIIVAGIVVATIVDWRIDYSVVTGTSFSRYGVRVPVTTTSS